MDCAGRRDAPKLARLRQSDALAAAERHVAFGEKIEVARSNDHDALWPESMDDGLLSLGGERLELEA